MLGLSSLSGAVLRPGLTVILVGMLQYVPVCQPAAHGNLIYCRCNTWDCEEQNRAVCTTNYQCYVQVEHSDESNEDIVTFGCLSRHSIMCENPRPEFFNGDWPIMHCCSTDYCNKDVVPTKPPQWHNDESALHTTQPSHSQPATNHNTSSQHKPASPSHPTINPLYIAFPIAGACILLALIIFAVYLLRRQPQPEYKYHSTLTKDPCLPQQNSHNHNGFMTQPHGNAAGSCVHNGHTAVSCVHNGLLPHQTVAHSGPVATVEPFAHRVPVSRPYPDGERSSSGSESKLLMRA